MNNMDADLDDLMAPDWKYILEHIHPQSMDVIRGTAGFKEETWRELLENYADQVALTPQLTETLKVALQDTLKTQSVLKPTDIIRLAQEAELVQATDVVIADGGILSIPVVTGATIISLYFLQVVGVIVNNALNGEKGKQQAIPSPADIVKHINFSDVVREVTRKLPQQPKTIKDALPKEDASHE